jgi:hypothetical protein
VCVPRRLLLILALPPLALILWLVAAQLPRWTAPQPGWFTGGEDTPGVCAAVGSLALYGASRGDPSAGIGLDAARTSATKVVAEHYDAAALALGDPLAVQAALPNTERRAYYVVTALLTQDALPKAAVIYLDAATGEPRALITATEDPAVGCAFNLRAALLDALRSPPALALGVYLVVVIGGALLLLAARRLRGRRS